MSDWDTGMLPVIADADLLAELMPLRRGPVQGPAARSEVADGVYRRLLLAATIAGSVGYAAAQDVGALAGTARPGSFLAAAAGGVTLVVVYIVAARALRVTEVDRLDRRVRVRITGLIPG